VAASNRPASAGSSTSSRNVVANARAGKGGRKPSESRGGRSSLWENVRAFLGTVLVFLVIRTFLIEAFRIPSGSMIPTLLVGDWLFVNKLVYGPHVPFTDVNLPGYSAPRRGDVVVFESPYQEDEARAGADPTPTLVKRLVGVPGDTLFMRGGALYVNGIPQRQGYQTSNNFVGDPSLLLPTDVQVQYDWKQHAIRPSRFDAAFGAAPTQPSLGNWGPVAVPAGLYFMMGDNRYCSKDGRYWGLVPRANLRGRPVFVYYSYRASDASGDTRCNPDQSTRSLPALTDIRWGRIGHVIR
jgi:signal peptidase I